MPTSKHTNRVRPHEQKGSEHFTHVFVYGSLKRGLGNYSLLEYNDAEFVGFDTISGPLTMVSFGGFPAVCHDSSVRGVNTIFGQTFRIPAPGLLALDALEGHPRWYRREQFQTDEHNRKAWIYLQPESEITRHEAVPENMWRMAMDEQEYWKGKNVIFKDAELFGESRS